MTPARLRALEVLDQYGTVHISNQTSHSLHHVYWQTAAWLVEQGYAVKADYGQTLICTTSAHLALLEAQKEASDAG